MKRIERGVLLALVLLASGVSMAAGQPKAIALRLGWVTELRYQHSLGPGFFEGGLGLPWMAPCIAATVTYDYVPKTIENDRGGAFELFVGGGLGTHTFIYKCSSRHEVYTAAGVVAAMGFQYRTAHHFQVGLSWRPMFGAFFGDVRPTWYKYGLCDVGLSLGYAF